MADDENRLMEQHDKRCRFHIQLSFGELQREVHPLAPYALRGVRMNADATAGTGAAERIVAMVKQWRELFGQDFYFINCTRMRYATSQPPLTPMFAADEQNNAIRESLKLFGGDKREDAVELKDLADWLSHYLEKAESGRRLGLAALTLAYGQKQTADGACPRMAETKIEHDKAIVRFDLVGDGMVYQPSIEGISGVYLRGKTGPGRWAQVKVLGKDTVEFSHPDIADLETVAYSQDTNPHETLFNSAGMPASGFLVTAPVNLPKAPDPVPPFQIVSMEGEDARFHILNNAIVKNAKIDLAHVRRGGYVFQIVGDEKVDLALQPVPGKDNNDEMEKSSATIPVTGIHPQGMERIRSDDWRYGTDIRFVNGMPVSKGLVKTGGKLVKATETIKDGSRFVTFDAPIDRTWIIVAETGKAAGFRKINRY